MRPCCDEKCQSWCFFGKFAILQQVEETWCFYLFWELRREGYDISHQMLLNTTDSVYHKFNSKTICDRMFLTLLPQTFATDLYVCNPKDLQMDPQNVAVNPANPCKNGSKSGARKNFSVFCGSKQERWSQRNSPDLSQNLLSYWYFVIPTYDLWSSISCLGVFVVGKRRHVIIFKFCS